MPFYPTQFDINLLSQPQKHIYGKVELLNKDYMVINSWENNLVSDSYNLDATSNIRRTYNCELHITDDSLFVGKDKQLWFDKYIRVYVGVYALREQKIIWYLKGTFASSTASYKYDAKSKTLSLQCNDLMCMLTGDIDGIQTGLKFKIDAGEDIRTSIIGIIKLFGFVKYRIPDLPRKIPYDLEFQVNTTAYDMITQLMEFSPNYEFFFDLEGTFVVQRIPCYSDDIDVLDESVINNLLISEDNYTVNFTTKNCIEIWGKSYGDSNISRFTDVCTYANNTYSAVFQKFEEVTDYMIIGIKIPEMNQKGFKIALNNLGSYDVIDDYGHPIEANVLSANTSYTFLYNANKLTLLGQFNIHAIYKNTLKDSPFNVENVGKELWAVFSGDEYEKITSDTLAKERAMYECYYKANLNESLSLTVVDIPWLDVNQKLPYTLRSTGEFHRYMINSISGETLSGQCTLNLSKFYPDWSEIFRQNFA